MYKASTVILAGALAFLFGTNEARAQQQADVILINGKIITVDDKSFTSRIGTIAQAMAILDGRIAAVGSNADVRRLSGSNTKVIDLKGRTVLPGLISVHEHPFDWAPVNPWIIKKVLADDSIVTRVIEGSPEEQSKAFPGVLREAVSRAKPGQWIYIVFTLGKNYEYSAGGNGGFGAPNARIFDGKLIPKELLDDLAPNNPVLLRDAFTGMMVNRRALEEAKRVFPQPDLTSSRAGQANEFGLEQGFRWLFHDVVMRDKYKELREIHRLELGWWAGYGMTAFASQAYAPSNVKIYNDLSRSQQMPIRNMWAWNWRENVLFEDNYVINSSVFMEGLGNDFFWYGGARGAQTVGRGCSSLTPRVESPPQRLGCAYDPGSKNYQMLYRYIKNGGRFAVTHTVGDRDIDNILDIIEKASREAGLMPEEIRAKRHTFDHLVMAPRPDQLKRIKELGLVLGGDAFEIYQASPGVLETFGEREVEWVVPKKSPIDAQIPSGLEVDRALGSTDLTIFWTLARMIDRKAWNGKAYGLNQKISRELALKSATIWGAYYLLKEDKLGSLEAGKWADFIVIDRDYLTIPEEEIERIRVLMTVVGGKVVHLVPSLAKELGMKPTGAQVELGAAAAGW